MYNESQSIPLVNDVVVLKELFINAFHGSVIASVFNNGRDLDLLIQGIEYFLTLNSVTYGKIQPTQKDLLIDGLKFTRAELAKQKSSKAKELISQNYPSPSLANDVAKELKQTFGTL